MTERLFGPQTFTYDPARPYGLHFHTSVRSLEGGQMSKVLLIESKPPLVLKAPYADPSLVSAEGYAAYEGIILALLNETEEEPPVRIPRTLDCDSLIHPPRNILSYVPGDVLDTKTIRQLPAADGRLIGRALGSFVAWMANALPTSLQNEIADEVDFVQLSRKDVLGIRLDRAERLNEEGYYNLVETMYELYDTYDNVLPPEHNTIIGHDDLRAANLTFTKGTDDRYQLQGGI